MRHFLNLSEIPAKDLRKIIDESARIKKDFKAGKSYEPLKGKAMAMIFEKPSTRTRISFEMALHDLGGKAIYLARSDIQLGRGESIGDTARVLARYTDMIMIRSQYHETVQEFADNSSIPVINGLTNKSHPCQIMADIMTFEEHRGKIKGAKLAWVGDCNNVCTSMIEAAQKFDFTLNIGSPKRYWPKRNIIDWVKENNAAVHFTDDVKEAVRGVDCIITDTWASMGDEEPELKKRALAGYQVDAKLMKLAHKDAVFMHCLPAYRGEEVTAEVIDGKKSIILDEAENRLHVQKGIMLWCLKHI